jgi:hypothetical protein
MKKILISFTLFLSFITLVQAQPDNRMTDATYLDPSGFKNMKTFYGSGTLQLPQGTTRILVEVWGAGGGGSTVGGGGGGAYGKAIINVFNGSKVTVSVGTGGRGGERGNDGQHSTVNYNPANSATNVYVFLAQGGKASMPATIASRGDGGAGASSTGSDVGFYSKPGEDGQLFEDSYQQAGPTTFNVTRHIGNGGNAGNSTYTGGRGAVFLNPQSPSYERYGTDGKIPGGGGGGGRMGGYNGANGMVIVYY